MKGLPTFLALLLLLAAHTAVADSLRITAAAQEVTIAPGAAGRRYARLDALNVEVSVTASCSNGSNPRVSLSSADTRKQIEDISTPQPFIIPASQLPPLWVEGFCILDDGLGQTLEITRPAFISILGSSRCEADESNTLTSRTAIVDLSVICDPSLLDVAQEPLDSSDSARNSSVRSQD